MLSPCVSLDGWSGLQQCNVSCVFQEEAGKSVLAEFNLGCDVEHTQHVYRVYVTTFLGFGGNMARQRYEDQLVNNTLAKNRFRLTHTTY